MRIRWSSAVEHELGQRLAQLGLADAGRAEEEEGTIRTVGIGQAGARTADGIADQAHGFVLPDDALVQAIFHVQQLFTFALHHLADRNAGGATDHFGDFLGADLGAQQLVFGLFFRVDRVSRLQLPLKLRQLAILQLGHLVELAFALQPRDLCLDPVDFFLDVRRTQHGGFFRFPDFLQIGILLLQLDQFFLDQSKALFGSLILLALHRLALDLELDHPPFEFVHDFRLGVDLHLDPRGRLVDQIDRLVRQETVGDVAMRQLGRSDDGRVGDVYAMVQFVFFLQAAQDGDGRFDARFLDQHLLEAPFERGILFDVLAVFVERRGADAVQFAAGQRRLEHVAGVDGTFGLAGADHGVQFVDEQDDLAFFLRDFLEHRLQPFLEFAAILGTGQQAGHVEDQHLLALQRVRHLFIDDALGEAFDDGRLADARLADQHRIVLGTALQDLHGAANFVVAADHRVELALGGTLGEVDAVFLERFALAFGFLRIDALPAAHRHDRRLQRLALQAMLFGEAPGLALVVGQGEQEHFAGDELVAALLRFLVGEIEQVVQVAADRDIAAVAFDLGQAGQRLLHVLAQACDIDAGAGKQRRGAAVLLIDQCEQQVLRFDELLVAANRQALGIGQRLLELGGEFVESHERPLRRNF